MCVIIQAPAGTNVSFDKFKNATLNNPDGYGIVFIDRGKLTECKGFDANGNDPDLIYKQLENSKGVDRVIHLRKQTVGEKSLDNTHPFKVLGVEGRNIFFFHNGTIGTYRPTGVMDTTSDTRNFATNFLQPLLYKFSGDKGIGDYTDPFFAKLFSREFGSASGRALLVGSDLPIKEFGDWKELKENDTIFRVSNLDYFDKVEYNRLHESRREAERSSWPGHNFQQQRAANPANPTYTEANKADEKKGEMGSVSNQLAKLKNINLSKITGRLLRQQELESLASYVANDFDDLDNETLSWFAYLAPAEISSWVDTNKQAASILLENMFVRFSELYEDYTECDEQCVDSVRRHEAATDMIKNLKKNVGSLEAEIAELRKALASVNKKTRRTVPTKDSVAKQAVEEMVA